MFRKERWISSLWDWLMHIKILKSEKPDDLKLQPKFVKLNLSYHQVMHHILLA
ncbi:unnamed protein product [Moneuplotes crassus]|uniref:Uncharacterized protein n=1 Tax=Euplotes crassus TaxID=5936 RepID=A0AAD2D673_EUPCR|nr:unnamed protein product [Moneuplotes crassus]